MQHRRRQDSKGLSSSLEPPETTAALAVAETAAQRALHRPVAEQWHRVVQALGGSIDDRLRSRSERIARCGMAPMLVLSAKGRVNVSPGYCRDRMCPTCQGRRSREVAARCTDLTVRMDAPRFMTLTLRAVGRPLFLTIAALTASFKVLRETTEWKRHVRGGVYVIEVTRGADGGHWHAHVHVICDGEFWHQRDISRVWKRVTGDSEIVDIRAVHSRAAAANYVAKYVSKPTGQASWTDTELCEFADAMHGRRMVHTFGCSYAEEVEPEHAGEAKVKAEPLCTMNRVHWLARRGDAYARFALELLRQHRGLLARLADQGGHPLGTVTGPPTEHDVDRLVYCLRNLGARHADQPICDATHWDQEHAREIAYARRQHVWWWVDGQSSAQTPP